MTVPINGDAAPVNIDEFCCADPEAGGCPHSGSMHIGPAGECQGVFGCSCKGFRKHKRTCLHNTVEGVTG